MQKIAVMQPSEKERIFAITGNHSEVTGKFDKVFPSKVFLRFGIPLSFRLQILFVAAHMFLQLFLMMMIYVVAYMEGCPVNAFIWKDDHSRIVPRYLRDGQFLF
ncbi:expressed unknown protein [Seminavis robusta]|uniref:Uncharacterized protein n=1 Tax=Seminavis robusta TaxID=568900 RepID=A0A9N8DNY3_9STRA|nr:expressed unknown protein [Seminavis robusta]|eukprot:Sro267_g103541.1  (104) ;mRNA; f:72954-73265